MQAHIDNLIAPLPRILRHRCERRDDGRGKADHHARGSRPADASVHRHAGKHHDDVGQDAAADPGKPGNQPDSQSCHMPDAAAGRLIEHWPKPAGSGEAHRDHKAKHRKDPARMLPGMWGTISCATITPTAIPGPQSRKKAKSAFPARQWSREETIAAGRIAASEVPTATCAAWSAEIPAATNP
jgi:hypothetical protein